MTPRETVEAFLEAMERLDIEGALEHASPDIVYQNVPFPPARGIEATRRTLNSMARVGTGFQAHIHNIAADGPVVLTERTDVLESGRVSVEFWVDGTFEVHDGKITLWRDRFDFANVMAGIVRGLARAAASFVTGR